MRISVAPIIVLVCSARSVTVDTVDEIENALDISSPYSFALFRNAPVSVDGTRNDLRFSSRHIRRSNICKTARKGFAILMGILCLVRAYRTRFRTSSLIRSLRYSPLFVKTSSVYFSLSTDAGSTDTTDCYRALISSLLITYQRITFIVRFIASLKRLLLLPRYNYVCNE